MATTTHMARKWVVLLTFVGEAPKDDLEAEQMADEAGAAFAEMSDSLPFVIQGSVSIVDVGTIEDDDEPSLVLMR